ncbi:MAG TPA: polysaccharide deacetylase family protein, partial [Turneriella sp.]|nr:polysaccharide deacetylase family protein [Turneriella sp.]
MSDAPHPPVRPPYSRFKGFLFLTVFIFAIIAGIVYIDSRKAMESAPLAKVATEKATATKNASVVQGEIPLDWRNDLGVPVLCYHQIVTEAQYREKPTPFAVTAKEFAAQMDWLYEKKFYTILPDDLVAYTRGEKNLDFNNGKRPIVLTFDDGNNDFIEHALQPMNKYGYKGVLFIYPTYIMAKPHKKRALTWEQIRNLGKAGHAIESHTMWHPNLSTMSDD